MSSRIQRSTSMSGAGDDDEGEDEEDGGPAWERCIRLRDAVCNLNASGLRFVPPAGEWLEGPPQKSFLL